MKSKDSHQKVLQRILEEKSFEKLGHYTKDEFWKALNLDERRLLAELLILHGELLLSEDDERVLVAFKAAAEILPEDPSIYCIQGVLLSSHAGKINYFEKAAECFEKATIADPNYFEAWFFWGKLIQQKAEELEDDSLANQADGLFAKASKYRADDPELEASFYWNWGMVDSLLGRLHGEAIDFKRALNKFSISASLGASNSEFWEHYGHTVCELGSLVNRPEALIEGREHFDKAVKADPNNGSAWLSLAYCDQKLYEIFAKPENYEKGCESFESARPFYEEDQQFWWRWGILLFLNGRLTFNPSNIEASFEKFQKAHECEPDNPLILSKWAEAEMVYGIYNERIDFFRRAENRIISSLKLQDNNPEGWYIYGTCLNEIGRYFSDVNYYHQAIEKYQYGLYLAPNDPLMSQGISQSYYSIGEMKGDTGLIELSVTYSEKAVEDSNGIVPQFLNDLGVSLMKMAEITGDKSYLEAAVEKLEQALANANEDNPDSLDPEWLYNYGCALDFLGDFYEDASYYERAIQALLKFLHLNSEYIHVHYNLASAYSHLGELVGDVDCFHKAIEHYQSFLAEDNEDEMVWNDYGLTLLNLAELLYDPTLPHLSQLCMAQAEEKFLHAISLGYSAAFYNLACLYSITKHFPQAMYYMEKAEQQRSLPSLDEILEDEWLENLRLTPEFRSFLNNLSTRNPD